MKALMTFFVFWLSCLSFPGDVENNNLEGKNSNTIETHEKSPIKYEIKAQLFPELKKLSAEVILDWTNNSEQPVDNLRFHLYFNSFRNEKTLLFKQSGFNRKSNEQLKNFRFGEIKIKEMRIVEGEELTEKINFVSPENSLHQDRTLMEVALRVPIQPQQSVKIKIEFFLIIPQFFTGTGCADDYFFMGHWFPKICVLQKNGVWNCHKFHDWPNFFSEYGIFRVYLTTPEKFVIGASGVLVKKQKNDDGTYTHIFEEKNIHDFAWVAYPYFTKIVEHLRLKGNSEDTSIILLLAPEHQQVGQRYLGALKSAMNFYADNIFPYPYRNITVVDTPLEGINSANKAYPTLLTVSHKNFLPAALKSPETDVTKGFSHQYWYGIMGCDPVNNAWLIKGINSFFEMEILDEYFKNSGSFLDSGIIKIENWQYHRFRYVSLYPVEKVAQPSTDFLSDSHYMKNVCSKVAILLRSLKNHVGRDKLFGFFKYYTERYKYRHTTSNDFIQSFNKFMNEDFNWAFDQFIKGDDIIDNAVYSVNSNSNNSDSGGYKNEVIFLRNAGYFPVELMIKLRNKKEITYFWQEREKWKKIVFYEDSPIEYAIVDPKFKVLLDVNIINNSRFLKAHTSGIKKFASKFGFIFQNIMSFFIL